MKVSLYFWYNLYTLFCHTLVTFYKRTDNECCWHYSCYLVPDFWLVYPATRILLITQLHTHYCLPSYIHITVYPATHTLLITQLHTHYLTLKEWQFKYPTRKIYQLQNIKQLPFCLAFLVFWSPQQNFHICLNSIIQIQGRANNIYPNIKLIFFIFVCIMKGFHIFEQKVIIFWVNWENIFVCAVARLIK
jgi:hypothetical protein